jgi:hypothetical protein
MRAKSLARARQKHINRHFKHFGALFQPFRHNLQKHADVFFAAAVIINISLQTNESFIMEVENVGKRHTDPWNMI